MTRPSRTLACRPQPAAHSRQVVLYQVGVPGIWSSGATRYGISFSVGSGPMPQPARTAAPPPVTPSTFKNRLRSIPSLMARSALVVTGRAVPGHLPLRVAADAPAHTERGDLGDLGHRFHLPVARRARVRSQDLDVSLMRE